MRFTANELVIVGMDAWGEWSKSWRRLVGRDQIHHDCFKRGSSNCSSYIELMLGFVF